MLEDVLTTWGAHEVTPMAVYQDIFKLGEGLIQHDENDTRQVANPLIYYKNRNEQRGHYRIMFENDFEDCLREGQEADFCILNGLTYWGRKNTAERASKMYALIFDLDGVDDTHLTAFLSGATRAGAYPTPNYIILSGHGVHLYYVFEQPVNLYPETKRQMKELKYALTIKIWNMYTSVEKKAQVQGINQGFRVIGGHTKIPGVRVRAFAFNTHPFSITQLNQFVEKQSQVNEQQIWPESRMTIAEAAKKYPQWFQRVVVDGIKGREKWDIAAKVHGKDPWALYHWWQKKIREGASYGHRYFCIMMMVIYGVKCDVPEEQVLKDAKDLIPFLHALNPKEPFTADDVRSAMDCYDERYCTFPLRDISKLTAIRISPNKRNGRKQAQHCQIMRFIRDEINGHKDTWRKESGRKPKSELVFDYRQQHPNENPTQVARALKISRPTVYRWWNWNPADALKEKDSWLYDLLMKAQAKGQRISIFDGEKAP